MISVFTNHIYIDLINEFIDDNDFMNLLEALRAIIPINFWKIRLGTLRKYLISEYDHKTLFYEQVGIKILRLIHERGFNKNPYPMTNRVLRFRKCGNNYSKKCLEKCTASNPCYFKGKSYEHSLVSFLNKQKQSNYVHKKRTIYYASTFDLIRLSLSIGILTKNHKILKKALEFYWDIIPKPFLFNAYEYCVQSYKKKTSHKFSKVDDTKINGLGQTEFIGRSTKEDWEFRNKKMFEFMGTDIFPKVINSFWIGDTFLTTLLGLDIDHQLLKWDNFTLKPDHNKDYHITHKDKPQKIFKNTQSAVDYLFEKIINNKTLYSFTAAANYRPSGPYRTPVPNGHLASIPWDEHLFKLIWEKCPDILFPSNISENLLSYINYSKPNEPKRRAKIRQYLLTNDKQLIGIKYHGNDPFYKTHTEYFQFKIDYFADIISLVVLKTYSRSENVTIASIKPIDVNSVNTVTNPFG